MTTIVTTRFGFESTAAEVAEGIDLDGARAIVTGAASGIGVETARALAGAGARVTLAVRDTAAGERTAAEIAASTGRDTPEVARLDLADRTSVDAFVARWNEPLHLLVDNAGVMALQELTHSPEGWELQFATNHLGHFRLAVGLHDALAADGHARIVAVSSSGHLRSPVVFDDLHYAFRDYDPFGAYGQSKTANILFAVGATERWAADGITANALNPGGIPTNLQRHVGGEEYIERAIAQSGGKLQLKTVEQGAATSVLLATSPDLEGVGGRYFNDCNEAEPVASRAAAPPRSGGVAPYALDHDNAARLWDVSMELIGG
jgi:NAD(P)-dependent dehydrogenase (short-subunit alcohol dehydrogenase family)